MTLVLIPYIFPDQAKINSKWRWIELGFIHYYLFAHLSIQKKWQKTILLLSSFCLKVTWNRRIFNSRYSIWYFNLELKRTGRFLHNFLATFRLDSVFKSSVLCAKSRYYLLSGVVTILVFEQQQSFRHGHKGGDCGWREQ